jgi:hypothetical protein
MASRYGFRIPPGSSRRPHGQRCALRPAQIRQVRAGGPGEGRKAPVPHVLLSATLAGPAPSGSTGHVPALSGLLPPSPPPRGSGCPQLQRPAATGHRRRSLTSTRTTAPHGANDNCARATTTWPLTHVPRQTPASKLRSTTDLKTFTRPAEERVEHARPDSHRRERLAASSPAGIQRDLLGADGGRDSSRAAGNICRAVTVARHVSFHQPQIFI